MNMISENYSLSRDRAQWILTEHYGAKDKDDNDVIKTRNSYHSNLKQIANYLVDNNECHNLDEYIEKAVKIKAEIEGLMNPRSLVESKE